MSIDHFSSFIARLPNAYAWRGQIQREILKVIAECISEVTDELIFYSKIKNILFDDGSTISDIVRLNDDLYTLGSVGSLLGDQGSINGKLQIWEYILDLLGVGTKEQRLQAIISALINVGFISLIAIQTSLQDAGFDVFIHSNSDSQVSSITYGSFTYGGIFDNANVRYTKKNNTINPDIINSELCVNYIDSAIDESKYRTKFTNDLRRWGFAFFIGGQSFGSRANIDSNLKESFRELILRIKPASMWAVLLIDYI